MKHVFYLLCCIAVAMAATHVAAFYNSFWIALLIIAVLMLGILLGAHFAHEILHY